ncbi:MAG: SwmB domain-containing protein [Gemmatimonadota bacterium]|nr:SwmB domain-containing protein [Gemmatimonadota bacterium]
MALDTSRPRRTPITASHARRGVALLLGALAALLALLPAPGFATNQGAPSVTFVAVSSVPGGDSTYGLGETIRVTLTFSESVTVTGTPRLAIDMDPADWGRKWAAYESGSGTSGLTFAHTVVQPNFSSGGIAVLADSLELNGGAIRSASSQADAALGHAALDHDADHRVDWQLSPPQPNRAPVLNTATRNHERFVAEQNAPRGFLVSKSFAGLFSDPDGDQLTYAVSITGGRAQLAEDVTIGSWGRSDVIAAKSPHPREATMRVFLEVDAEDDWDALEPPLPERPVITVTLTATDPGGLSASVQGDFLIIWEPAARVLTQKNLDDHRANSLGPRDSGSEQATGPTVTAVNVASNAGPDKTYFLGETIRIALTFSEAVDVTGAPHLKIDMDPADWGRKVVPYESGSGTDTLVFAHVVVEPNYSTQGIAVLEDTLDLNGGTIQSSSSQTAADLAHDGLAHQGEHRVNWKFPPGSATVIDVEVTSDPGADDFYELGETIRVSLTFSEAVDVTGTPELKIDMDPADWGTKVAAYESGSGTDTLTFAHVVVQPNYSMQGIAVLADSLALNGGTIKSTATQADAALAHFGLAHQENDRVNWRYPGLRPDAPAVTYLAISSDAGSDRLYTKGEVIRVTLRLSEAAHVTGAPRLKLDLHSGDDGERWADYESGSGGTSLVFAYTVVEGDGSPNGVAVAADSLELNGGTIVSATDASNTALLAHTGLARNPNHRVDCIPPMLLSAVVEGTTLTLRFDEALGEAGSLSSDQFAVARTPQGGTEEPIGLIGAPVISDDLLTLTLASAVVDTDTDVKISYTKPTTGQNNRLIDLLGNEAESFSDVSVSGDTTPPRLVSGQVDSDTMYLFFSEPLDETSLGGWFRISATLTSGATIIFTTNGPVEIEGNQVTVVLGRTERTGKKWVVKAGVQSNHAYYVKDYKPGAQVLRDLAGNPVETPRLWGIDWSNGELYATPPVRLENITAEPP